MSHVYRREKLGDSLMDALQIMIESGKISEKLASEVMQKFDDAMARSLETTVGAKAIFKGRLQVYRFIDNVWTFVMANATLRLAPFLSSSRRDEEELQVDGPLLMMLVDAKLLQEGKEGGQEAGAGGKT